MTPTYKLWLFLLLAVVALAVHMVLFSYRYMWYISAEEACFLWAGDTICLLAIIALWALFPSRFLIATISVIAFIFPPLVREDSFVSLSVGVAGLLFSVLVSLLLLVGVTELRRRVKFRE